MKKIAILLGIIASHCIFALVPSLENLTLDEKIGQIMMIAAVSDEQLNKEFIQEQTYTMDQQHVETMIKNHHVGGIIFLGKGDPEKQAALTQHFQSLSRSPLLIGQDLEWGLSMRLNNTIRFPRNMTLGALRDNNLIYAMASDIARQAQTLGVHMILSPVVDVNNNPANPVINDRSFGSNKDRVAQKGIAFMRGLQDNGIIACAKHFPGHGNTNTDSHDDLPRITAPLDELNNTELVPFRTLINAGVKAVMTAHLAVPALEKSPTTPTSLSYAVVTTLLRQHLNFQGLIVTDGLGMRGVTKHHEPGNLEVSALKAGTDLLLCPVDVTKAHAAIKQAVVSGELSEQEIDEHVARILALKKEIFARHPAPTPYDHHALHRPESYALKKKLYEQAITRVRDNEHLIPIKKGTPITLIEIGQSSTFGHHCAQNRECYVHKLSAQPSESACAEIVQTIDSTSTVIVAIAGMNKFISQDFGISKQVQDLVAALNAHKKLILILFGSAYSITLFPTIPSMLVAYEDDSDAQIAAADVIMGNLVAQGELPV